jgi:hypothetical protein
MTSTTPRLGRDLNATNTNYRAGGRWGWEGARFFLAAIKGVKLIAGALLVIFLSFLYIYFTNTFQHRPPSPQPNNGSRYHQKGASQASVFYFILIIRMSSSSFSEGVGM